MPKDTMWAVFAVAGGPFLPLIPEPTDQRPFAFSISASARPPRHRSSSTQRKQQQIRKQGQEKNQEQGRTKQLSGLDVLWAMQRAAAEKNKLSGGTGTKKNKKRKGLSSAGSQIEDDGVDYSNVRPLCIKNGWSIRLDELEKRLEELSMTK